MTRLVILLAPLAAVVGLALGGTHTVRATGVEEEHGRDLLGITYTNSKDQAMGAGATLSTGCYHMGGDYGKLKVMVCLDKKGVAALEAAQPKVAYAQVQGVFQNDGRTPSCKFSWEGLDEALFKTLSATPPQIMVQKKETFAATEKATFSFVLPMDQNAEGSTLIQGNTGSITMCTLTQSSTTTTTTTGGTTAAATTTTTTTSAPKTTTEEETPAAVAVVAVDPPVAAAAQDSPATEVEEALTTSVIDKQGMSSPAAAGAKPMLMTLAFGAAMVLLVCMG